MSMEQSPFTRIKRPLNSDMNVVPYIDVMLVLLVIFMVTAPMLTTGVEVNLPTAQADSLPIKQSLPIIISLKQNGELYMSHDDAADELVDQLTLIEQLKVAQQKDPNLSVLINADKNNPYGNVMILMSALQQSGISQVGLLTETPS